MENSLPRCQHLMASGLRCATPPMKYHAFCYYHRRMHDAYSLPGQSSYLPIALDCPQAITVALHHLELALNKGFIDLKDYKARLFAIQLAMTALKFASQNMSSQEPVAEYTPAMRTLHRLDPNKPCSDEPFVPTPLPSVPLEPPCPVEWLRPPQMSQAPDPNRLWYPMTSDEWDHLDLPDDDKLGSLPQEIQLRRLKLHNSLPPITNPTRAQIIDSINNIETQEITLNAALAMRRCNFLRQVAQPVDSSPSDLACLTPALT